MSADSDSRESLQRLARSLEFDAFFLYILGKEFCRTIRGINLMIRGRLTVDFKESDGLEHHGQFAVPVETSGGAIPTEPNVEARRTEAGPGALGGQESMSGPTGQMGGTFTLRVPRGLDGGEPRHILDTATIKIQIEFFPRA